MPKNPELELALQFIENTDRNLFVTGKAGTGKTTFLHKIKNESLKRLVIVAPTGVAAINAKGVTIHSFFQMPFGPILPNQPLTSNTQQRKFSKTKIDIIKSLDLVIIDEISMVRADLLDAIDQVLRRFKNRNKVFGGAQVLLIGDLQQLAPVAKPNEWSLLQQFYETMYFFSAKSFKEGNFVPVELKHIYRQKNEAFINILNEVRNDTLSKKSEEILMKQYDPAFSPSQESGYITLTTHNRRANAINEAELNKLETKSCFFTAEVSGKFNENAFPNAEQLELKIGAQVMFIKNDSSHEKRYFNGKIGTIISASKATVTVKCDDNSLIETEKETWENVSYAIDEETKEIKENVAGSFSQIPLRLAWAITIHKSQGLTFDKAVIDAEASFAHGQTYVALSRCTSLEGLVLKTPITANAIINDNNVSVFNEHIEENQPTENELIQSEIQFQLNLVAELFDFQAFLYPCQRMVDVFYRNKNSIRGEVIEPLEVIKDNGIIPLMKIANGFKNQLNALSEDGVLPEKSNAIQERFQKGVNYFLDEVIKNMVKPLAKISFSSDNKQVKKDFTKQFDAFQELLSSKVFALKKMTDGFKTKKYLEVRANAVLQEKVTKKKKLSKSDPLLAVKLRELRSNIAEVYQIPAFQIFTQETLYSLCSQLPRTENELLAIKGMGKTRVDKYGQEILETIAAYCKENGIDTFTGKQKKEAKKNTKQITFELFNSGMSLKEIAKERKLTTNTIEGHLMSFIPTGEIDVLELIPLKRYKQILDAIEEVTFKNLTELKEKVDDSFTYQELRMVLMATEN
jgi:ATP-dependent exoDNAse (exonuclease V) alpha subunit